MELRATLHTSTEGAGIMDGAPKVSDRGCLGGGGSSHLKDSDSFVC